MKEDIRSLSRDQVSHWLQERAVPRYRGDQLLHWLYRRRVETWEAMGNLPKSLRQDLAETFDLGLPQVVREQGAVDTTKKYLWQLNDGALIESVLIPANRAESGEQSSRRTLCVSTQVGCAFGCAFCASGLDGWKRNLTPAEIVGQVLAVENRLDALPGAKQDAGAGERQIDNLVFMGMGEPLANYPHLIQALHILNADWGAGIGARRITISTSGLVPQIRQLADEPAQYRLAISLHGSTDAVRDKIMPINRRFPLKTLVEACEYFVRQRGKMITLEYILIAGVNDDVELTASLAEMALRLKAKVNLIPYNKVEGLSWKRPDEDRQEQFYEALLKRGVAVTLRREKGHDIDAACGQLRLKDAKGQALSSVSSDE